MPQKQVGNPAYETAGPTGPRRHACCSNSGAGQVNRADLTKRQKCPVRALDRTLTARRHRRTVAPETGTRVFESASACHPDIDRCRPTGTVVVSRANRGSSDSPEAGQVSRRQNRGSLATDGLTNVPFQAPHDDGSKSHSVATSAIVPGQSVVVASFTQTAHVSQLLRVGRYSSRGRLCMHGGHPIDRCRRRGRCGGGCVVGTPV